MPIIPTVNPDTMKAMLSTGYVHVSTRGVFEQFAEAYEETWVRKLRNGKKYLLPGAPSVTVSACFEPLAFVDFLDIQPDSQFCPNVASVGTTPYGSTTPYGLSYEYEEEPYSNADIGGVDNVFDAWGAFEAGL